MKFFQSDTTKKFINNFFNYTIFQATQYIVPLITIPYIISILGVEKFGIISLAQGVANYIRVGVDYGWNMLGVQYIARANDSRVELSKIISTILVKQLALSILGFVLLIIGIFVFPKVAKYWEVFIASYGLVIGNMLIAPWFFVGSQKVKYLNYVFLVSRLLYVLLIIVFLKFFNNILWVPVANSGSLIFGGLLTLYIIRKYMGIRFILPSWFEIKTYFKDGWPIFVSYFSTNFYRNSNVIILALFTSDFYLGLFSVAEKIVKVVQGIFMPLSQTLYPYLAKLSKNSKKKAVQTIKKVVIIMGGVAFIAVIVLTIFSPWIMNLMAGEGIEEGTRLIRIGSVVIFFGVINFIVGIIFMTGFGMKRQFSNAVLATGVFGIAACFLLSYLYQANGAMASFTLSEAFLFFSITTYSYKKSRNMVSINE